MRYHTRVVFGLLLVCCVGAAAKDKKKVLLPKDVLEAQTVLVVIDPNAGTRVEEPLENQRARQDVEKALMKWGRFKLVTDVSTADLVITVRKGSGRIADSTVGGVPMNNRPVVFQPTDAGGRGGDMSGGPALGGDPGSAQSQGPRPQLEVGEAQDMFAVYRGKQAHLLDSPAVWRYSALEALQSPGVPAVDEFRKLVEKAEKQEAATP